MKCLILNEKTEVHYEAGWIGKTGIVRTAYL